MALTKEQKKEIIDDLREKIERQKAIIFVDFTGMKVKELFDLRKKLKLENNEFKIYKKTLLRLVFKEKGVEIKRENLGKEVSAVFAFEDLLSSAKIVYEFSQNFENLKILGGLEKIQETENKTQKYQFLSAEQIIELAKIPSREELLGRIVGSLSSPISGVINVLQGNIKGLIYVLAKVKT